MKQFSLELTLLKHIFVLPTLVTLSSLDQV